MFSAVLICVLMLRCILDVEATVNDTQLDPEEELLSALLGSRRCWFA
jgi:hypothetical protein